MLLIHILLVICVNYVSGESITIENAGFEVDEYPVIDNKYMFITVPTGWDRYNPQNFVISSNLDWQLMTVVNPRGGTAINDPIFGDSVPEGNQCLNIDQFETETINKGEIVVTVGTTYTLTVWVGNSASNTWVEDFYWDTTGSPGYGVQLIADDDILNEDNNQLSIADGHWEQSIVTFTVLSNDSHIGKTLGIRLINKNSAEGCDVYFDDVQLEATTSSPISDTVSPTEELTLYPTVSSTLYSTEELTSMPSSLYPTEELTLYPTEELTLYPTEELTSMPSSFPTIYPIANITNRILMTSTEAKHISTISMSNVTETDALLSILIIVVGVLLLLLLLLMVYICCYCLKRKEMHGEIMNAIVPNQDNTENNIEVVTDRGELNIVLENERAIDINQEQMVKGDLGEEPSNEGNVVVNNTTTGDYNIQDDEFIVEADDCDEITQTNQ